MLNISLAETHADGSRTWFLESDKTLDEVKCSGIFDARLSVGDVILRDNEIYVVTCSQLIGGVYFPNNYEGGAE